MLFPVCAVGGAGNGVYGIIQDDMRKIANEEDGKAAQKTPAHTV